MRFVFACLILMIVAGLGWLTGSRMAKHLGVNARHDSLARKRPILSYLTANRLALVITVLVVLFGITIAVVVRRHAGLAIGVWIAVFALLQVNLIWLQVRRDRKRAAEHRTRLDPADGR